MTQTTQTHTPTPWKLLSHGKKSYEVIMSTEGYQVMDLTLDGDRGVPFGLKMSLEELNIADAAFIVEAVNSRANLLTRLDAAERLAIDLNVDRERLLGDGFLGDALTKRLLDLVGPACNPATKEDNRGA